MLTVVEESTNISVDDIVVFFRENNFEDNKRVI